MLILVPRDKHTKYDGGGGDDNDIETQTLAALSSRIRPSSTSSVSFHTLQSLLHASFSPSAIPSSYWLAGGCPAPIDVFPPPLESQNVRTHCQKSPTFMTLTNPGHLSSRTEIYGTPGQTS